MRGKRRATARKQATTSTKQSKKVAFPAEESSPTQNLKKEQITHQPVVYRYGIILLGAEELIELTLLESATTELEASLIGATPPSLLTALPWFGGLIRTGDFIFE